MLYKLKDCKNGFYIDNETTVQEFLTLAREYYGYGSIHCIICNRKTAKLINEKVFDESPMILMSKNHITINNNVKDGVFFINTRC